MALTPCYECGHQISTAAASCPNCGAPTKPPPQPQPEPQPEPGPEKKGHGLLIMLSILGFIGVIVFATGKMTTHTKRLTHNSSPITTRPVTDLSRGYPLVQGSDDLAEYKDAFARASLELIASGRCSKEALQSWGGWSRSIKYKEDPVYFTYCGGTRVGDRIYLNAENGVFTP